MFFGESLDTNRDSMLGRAQKLFELLGEGLDDEGMIREVVEALKAQHDQGMRGAGEAAQFILNSAEAQIEVISKYRWAESGFPILTMGHRYAAAMCCTTASVEAVAAARPPFPAYLIEVPDNVLTISDPRKGESSNDIRYILVAREELRSKKRGWTWSYSATTSDGLSIFRFGVTSAELLPPTISEIEDGVSYGLYEMTAHDERAVVLIGRLVVNTALAMSDPANVTELPSRPSKRGINSPFTGRRGSGPTARTYVLGKNITIKTDLRPEVRRYLGGERRSLSVQVLVAGHYKMQPHGPRNSLRKLIWREPYWRGPEDAPIPIRGHNLEKVDEK